MYEGMEAKVCTDPVKRGPIGEIIRRNTEHLLKCVDLSRRISNSLGGGVGINCNSLLTSANCMRDELENQSTALLKIAETLDGVLRILEG